MASSYLLAENDNIEAGPFHPIRVVVIGASIGAGHTSAALELQRRLLRDGIDAKCHDILDALPPLVQVALRNLYAPLVNLAPSLFGWLMSTWECDKSWMVQFLLWAASERQVLEWICGVDAIVTTHAIATQFTGRLKDQGKHNAPIASYHCDAGMHALLFHHAVSLNLVPIPAAARECRRYRHSATVILPLVQQRFREPVPQAACFNIRESLRLPLDTPIITLAAGSLGIGDVSKSVKDILAGLGTVRLLVLCGRNTRLQQRLQPYPRVIALGWREDIAEILAVSHVMVHNAGGMAVWEAMMVGLPMVTYNPLPGHGKVNARVLEESGISPWPRDRGSLGLVIKSALASGKRKVMVEGQDRIVVSHILEMISSG